MRKLIAGGLAALTMIATPGVSFADSWRGHGRSYYGYGGPSHYHGDHYRHGDRAVVAGVAGLALGVMLGAALSDRGPRYDAPPPRAYDGGYRYGPPSAGYYPQGQCFRRELVWDPRVRANVEVTHPYPC